MADASRSYKRGEPRRFLADPSRFGNDPATPWDPPEGADRTEVIAAYWQHLAACVVRAKFGPTAAEELARRLGRESSSHLRRQLTGVYRVRFEDLITWAVALDDITVLPRPDTIADLWPPQQ